MFVVLSFLFHFSCAGTEPTFSQKLGADAPTELHAISLGMVTSKVRPPKNGVNEHLTKSLQDPGKAR